MAGTDLLTGLIVQPMAVALEVSKILSASPFCTLEKIYSVTLAGIGFASIDHLALISVERYIASKYSLSHNTTSFREGLKLQLSDELTVCRIKKSTKYKAYTNQCHI
ncbi:unnamed protein product [Porites lobata]|uniref:Uncharacterized protein n=1 Tax=Porites lobata TaxID=104759 RepID=A0ABN8N2B1_9CNID|nr:unnamed protein product [Porites lobata]